MSTGAVPWFHVLKEPWGAVLALGILWLGIQFSTLGPLTPILVSQGGGLDKAQVVLFFVILVVTGIGTTLATGYLSDGRVPRFLLILVFGLLGAVGNAGLAAGGPPCWYYLFGALSSCGFVLFSQFFAVAQAGVMGNWLPHTRVLGTTVLRTIYSLGFILGTGLASFLLLWVELRVLFWTMAASGVTLAVVSAALVARLETKVPATQAISEGHPPHPSAPTSSVWTSLAALALPLWALALLQGADRARGVYLPLVTFHLYHDPRWAPMLFGTTAAFELVTMILLGSVAIRFGERWTIVTGALVGAACFASMAVFPSLPMLFLANVVYSIFNAVLFGVAMAYVQGMVAHRPGLGNSLFVLTMNLGALVGIFAPAVLPGYSPTIFFLPGGLCLAGALLMGERVKIRGLQR